MKIIIYWGLLLLSVCLHAQGKVASVLYYNQLQAAPSPIYMYVEDQLLGTVDASYEFGDEVQLPVGIEDGLKIVFSPELLGEGQTLPAGLPTVAVAKDWQEVLIFVVEAQVNERLPIQAIAINADEAYFGASDFLFINMSPNSIEGRFGEESVRIGPRQMHVSKMSAYTGELLDVKLDYIRPDDEGRRRWMIQQGWRVLPDRKTIVYCYAPKGRSSMKYYAVQIKDL